MWKKTARAVSITVGAFLLASLAAVGLPGTAAADDTVRGDCAATVASADGDPITVDVGALLGHGGVVDVGLGSDAPGSGDAGDTPALSLPVADTADTLGTDGVPVVPDTATEGCEGVKTTLNTVGGTTRSVLPGGNGDGEPPADPVPTDPQAEDGTSGTDGAGNPAADPESDDGVSGDQGAELTYVSLPQPAVALPPLGPPAFLELPSVPAPAAPDLNPDDGPHAGDTNTGRVDALPASGHQNSRVPFFLAVAFLAVVGAVFLRRWIARHRS